VTIRTGIYFDIFMGGVIGIETLSIFVEVSSNSHSILVFL
jgi:hypothetical protein